MSASGEDDTSAKLAAVMSITSLASTDDARSATALSKVEGRIVLSRGVGGRQGVLWREKERRVERCRVWSARASVGRCPIGSNKAPDGRALDPPARAAVAVTRPQSAALDWTRGPKTAPRSLSSLAVTLSRAPRLFIPFISTLSSWTVSRQHGGRPHSTLFSTVPACRSDCRGTSSRPRPHLGAQPNTGTPQRPLNSRRHDHTPRLKHRTELDQDDVDFTGGCTAEHC